MPILRRAGKVSIRRRPVNSELHSATLWVAQTSYVKQSAVVVLALWLVIAEWGDDKGW